nr:hypothetical protein [Tanacetum cinerariifolium]
MFQLAYDVHKCRMIPQLVIILEGEMCTSGCCFGATVSSSLKGLMCASRLEGFLSETMLMISSISNSISLMRKETSRRWVLNCDNNKKGVDADATTTGPSTSNSFDVLNNMDEGAVSKESSSRDIQAEDPETGPNTSMINEDLESDDEVDEFIYPEGDKFGDKFDIWLKGRVRK